MRREETDGSMLSPSFKNIFIKVRLNKIRADMKTDSCTDAAFMWRFTFTLVCSCSVVM